MKKIKKPILKKEDSLDYKISEYVSNLCQIIVWNYVVKVSWFRKDFLVSSILPKNERKQGELRYSAPHYVEFFCSFFGRILDTNKYFRDLPTTFIWKAETKNEFKEAGDTKSCHSLP